MSLRRQPNFVKGHGAPLGNPRRILLIQLGDIGDVVLSTPCIRALRDTFPNARLVVAVREKAAELLVDSSWLDDVIEVRKGKLALFGEPISQIDFVLALRRFSFDLVIDLRTGTRGAIMAKISGASRRIGFFAENETWWRNALFTDLLSFEYTSELYVADYLLVLLEAYGVCASHRNPKIEVSLSRQAEAKQLLAAFSIGSNGIVVLQPFSLWRYKEWGTEKYIGLIRWLVKKWKVVVLIVGNSAEQQRAATIVEACGDGCHNLAGKTSLSLYAAILKESRLFVGVDSAGLHMAAAVGTPTVGIFGPSSSSSWGPRGPAHVVVKNNSLHCVPCREKGCADSEFSRCLDELLLDNVVKDVNNQLVASVNLYCC